MSAAQQIRWSDGPEGEILKDCGRLVGRAQGVLLPNDNAKIAPETVKRLLREVHSVKGAASFLRRHGLTDSLHELEQALLAKLGSSEPMDKHVIGELFLTLEHYIGHGSVQVSNRSHAERTHRFGESLWWSHELTQSTARKLGKRVFVLVHGGDVPVARAVHRVLQNVMIHLVRNAVAHGIEAPEQRSVAGKPEIGLISISARQDQGGLSIDVSDNGAGLNAEAADSLFEMGRSSVDPANEHSGRGVGLSAVRELIEEAGGVIRVTSAPGEGMTFKLSFPAG